MNFNQNYMFFKKYYMWNIIYDINLKNIIKSASSWSVLYTGCPRRNMPDFGRVFLMLKYTDITQNTYVQSWTVKEIMDREKCGLLAGPRTVPVSWQSYPCSSLSAESYYSSSAHATLISQWAVSFVTSQLGSHLSLYCLEP